MFMSTSFMNLEHKDVYVRKYVSVSGTACFDSNLFLIKTWIFHKAIQSFGSRNSHLCLLVQDSGGSGHN